MAETELFSILAPDRRRDVIRLVAETGPDGRASCGQLARDIAAAELHMPAEYVPEGRIEHVDDELRRTHLPRLSEAGVVRWDPAAGTVTAGRSIEPVADLLQTVARRTEPLYPRGNPCGLDDETASRG